MGNGGRLTGNDAVDFLGRVAQVIATEDRADHTIDTGEVCSATADNAHPLQFAHHVPIVRRAARIQPKSAAACMYLLASSVLLRTRNQS